jgi:hypothetical protein
VTVVVVVVAVVAVVPNGGDGLLHPLRWRIVAMKHTS